MNQLEMEMKFSKRMKDFITLDAFINDAGKLMSDLCTTIEDWKYGDFWPEMYNLMKKLPDPNDVVVELMLTILTKYTEQQIQGVAVELGVRLGYNDVVEAAKIGSSLLAICHGELYDIELTSEATLIIPKLQIDNDAKRKIRELGFLPPNMVPAIWLVSEVEYVKLGKRLEVLYDTVTSEIAIIESQLKNGFTKTPNVGGWQWEKKSCILGAGNHHDGPQALDVLNQLQQVKWTIDTEVLVSEKHENVTHNELETLGHYVGKEFYFTWRYDKRGRLYSSGYQINPQSDEYGKAILSPVKAEVCTESGIRALKVDVSNYRGLDKESWSNRECMCYMDDIGWKKPILGRKALRALELAEAGEPVAHFIELDATSSGLQVMAALSGCVKTARLCNLVDTGKRENVYQHINDEMAKYVNMDDTECKRALMTSWYGSKAVPREEFNEEQLDVFYKVMQDMTPGAEECMEAIANCWNPYALEHSWTLPDEHVCKVKVIEKTDIRITVPELDDRQFTLRYNKNKPSTNGISILGNVIHSVDGYVCREMVRRCNKIGFEVSCIHDCWSCHPNHAEELKMVYREILAEIADSDLLNDICSQIIGKDAGISIDDEGLATKILNSEYALS